MPEHIWVRVFSCLSPSRSRTRCINNIHLVCRKFHELACLIPCHLYPTTVLPSEENVEALKKSSRIYDKVYFDKFEELTEIQLNQVITLLKSTGCHAKELSISGGSLSKFCLASFLKLVPNLKKLTIRDLYSPENPSQEQLEFGEIRLPKLTDFTICECDNEFMDLLMDFRDCSITDFRVERHFHGSNNRNIVDLIKKQEKSLKRLLLELISDNPVDWSFMGDLKEMRLEAFDLSFYRDDPDVLLDFLRQNGSTLKSLSLTYCHLTDEKLEGVCELLPNLEELRLQEDFDNPESGILALQKLKKLKKFSICSLGESNILESLTFAVNENMLEVEIEAPLQDNTTEFIAKLATCLPNLRKFRSGFVSDSQVEAILIYFRKLEEMTIYPANNSKKVFQHINDFGRNLAVIDFAGQHEWKEEFIRENLKAGTGLIVRCSDDKFIHDIEI